jgi:MoxR-like ATPase
MPWTSRFFDYLSAQPAGRPHRPDDDGDAGPDLQTGQPLVEKIVRAIELNQSVLLTGPRGCGKSWCIDEAIRQAQQRGLIPPGAKVFLQGNREIPRDYLAEDEIGFRTVTQGDRLEVIPENRSAPLFVFAVRDPHGGQPVVNRERMVELHFPEADGKPVANPRFVLFLDEINRFSDGLLDSLLSVLEERKAVLGGHEYRLPVVVCMTMNPPGYDASARRLSPPLAARIGRSFGLKTPDLDTLSDVIVRERLAVLRKQHEANRAGTPPGQFFPAFPEVSSVLLRLACLVTLALWGRIRAGRPSLEYLSAATRQLLARLSTADALLARHQERLAALCRFGPDGRAASDWLTAAVGLALDEATRRKQESPELSALHFLATARETLAHKLFDEFSSASQPEKSREKEQSIQIVAEQIFKLRGIRRLVARKVDDRTGSRWRALAAVAEGDTAHDCRDAVIDRLLQSQVTADEEVEQVLSVLEELFDDGDRLHLQQRMREAGMIEETLDRGRYAFTAQPYKEFFLSLPGALPPATARRAEEFFAGFDDKGIPFREVLRQNELVADLLTIDRFLALTATARLIRPEESAVAAALLEMWELRHRLDGENTQELAQEARGVVLGKNGEPPGKKALPALLDELEAVCRRRFEGEGGVVRGFLVRWLLRFRSQPPLSPEAQRWQLYLQFVHSVRVGLAP